MIIHTTQLKEHVGGEASLRGWLVSKQARGRVAFLTLRDGEGTAQLVCEREALGEAAFDALKALPQETPLLATGLVRVPEGRDSPELAARSIEASPSGADWPIGRKEHGPDFLMERRHLWLRAPRQAAILRIRSSLEFACIEFLHREGFHRFDSPLVTPTACEGTTELFELDYFGRPAYLSQSAQLYSEAGIASLGRVYSMGPCFRAEKSVTRRHLTEFWGVEPEMAHVDAEGNMAFQERFLRAILGKVAGERPDDLRLLGRDPETLVFRPEPFPVLLYAEAIERLAGLGEIITGGQRASDHDFLKSRIVAHGLSLEDFAWYLDLRKYGSVTHSGFGMGIERMLRWICGLHHIREAIPFARTPQRFAP